MMISRDDKRRPLSISISPEEENLIDILAQRHSHASRSEVIRTALQAYKYMMVAEPIEKYKAPDTEMMNELAKASISVSSIIIPERKTAEGTLIASTSSIWTEIIDRLQSNWSLAYELPPERWEELVATAFHKDGYDEVTLTRRSGDDGRDVIAIKKGVGAVKVIGSVKAYGRGRLVRYDDVRALLGVLAGEQDASKGIITTTSDFPTKLSSARFIKPFLPYRLELMNGTQLRHWLLAVRKQK
jgi:restriction system protein